MKPKLIFFYFILFTFNFLLVATATVRYVSKTGSSTPPYTSWAAASDSIQKCINICQNGDTVYVANGVYKEKIIIQKTLMVIGSGIDSCIIDTRELVTPTNFEAVYMGGADGIVFRNFSIMVSNGQIGTGIYNSYSGTGTIIEKNKISGAVFGMLLHNTDAIIKNNIFVNVDDGIRIGAFTSNFYPVIDSNHIAVMSYGVLISVGTKPTIRNNTFYLDDPFAAAYAGGGSDTAKVYNNLAIINNAQVVYALSGVPTIAYNNVAKGNFGDGIRFGTYHKVMNNLIKDGMVGFKRVTTSSITFHNNSWNNQINYQNFTPDSTNLSIDPMIVSDNMDSLDFHLQMHSPLIDAGDPNILDVDGSRSDIGLYGGPFGENYTYYDLAPRPPRNLVAVIDTNKVILKWNKNTEADTSYYKVYRDTVINFVVDSTKLISSQPDTIFTQSIPHKVSKYVYKITCVDKQGNESRPSEERVVNLTSINDYPMTINDYKLYPNYPNPFNSSTTIGYKLKERAYVKLMVYDIKGELVDVLVNVEQEAGYYEVMFDTKVGSRQSAVGNENTKSTGIYIYTIIVKGENGIPAFIDTGKMIYLK